MRLIGGQKVKKAKAKSRLRKLRRLLAESLEDRNMLAAISWDGGGGDLRWSNSLNWSSDRLPTASDDVSIDAGNEAIEIRSGTHSVRSIDLNSDLQIENARLFTEGFAIAPGSTLVVEGANSEFVANAATAIDGANFVASSNGMLTVGSVTTVSNTFGDMYWRATGAGSVLSFPDLKTINNGTGRNWDTFLESFQGGKLDLGAVTEIIDPNSGDLRQRSVQVKAEGVGSEVDLSSLQNFVDYAGYATSDSDGEYSRLHATLGGHIKLSELSIVRGVYFPVDSTGTIDLSTITSLSHGLVEAGRSVNLSALESGYSTDFVTSGPDIDLSNLHDADHAVFTIDGRDLNLDSVESIDGASFYVSGGVSIEIPSVTTVSNTYGDVYWRVTGSGSVLSFPNLTSVNNGTGRNWDAFLESLQGGKLDLGRVTEIIDPNSGDLRQRSVQVKAEGVGSEVDLSSLQNFVDYAGYATSDSDGEYSRLHATQGGLVNLGALSTVRGVYFPVDALGTIDLSTITSLSHGLVEAGRSVDLSALESGYSTDFVTSGPDIDLSNLRDADHAVFTIDGRDLNLDSVESIDGASFYVSGGVSIEIPSVTTVSNTYGDVYWRVTGSGSVLSFPNLTSVNNGTGRNWDAFLESLQGGKLDLGRVTEIIDPNSGDLRQRSVQVKAEGVGSEVDLSSLQNFVDYAGYATSDSDGEYSRLHATQGGLVNLGALSTVRGVYFPVDVLGTIDLSTITSLSHGLVEAGRSVDLSALESGYSTDFVTSGPDIDLSNLHDADHAVFTIDGRDLNLDSVESIDGASFYVSGGVSIEIPSVTTVSNTYGDVYWRVTGSGSVLSFPNLTSVNNGTGRNWDAFLESLQGGKLDLGRVTEIIDPNSGDLRQRSVQVKAEGVGSEVDLSSLQNFVDYAGYATSDSDGEYSRLHATQGGLVNLGALSTVRGVYFPVDVLGTIDLSTITSLSHGLVEAGRSVDLSALESGYSTDFVTSGPDIDLSNLRDADHAVFTIDGRDLNLDTVESIDGASFYVSGGVSIEIPSVTTVSNTYGDVYWRVTGSGSVLSFPNLTSVNNGTGRNWDTFLESLQGGKLDLGRVTEIIDPNSGDLRQRSVQVKAEGVDSEVDLSSLQNFVDYAGSATSDSDGEYSRLHATQGGTIALGNHLTTRGIYIPIELQSRLLVGTLELSSSSLLNGSGSIVGNLINRSMVNTNSLSIEGSYYQVGGSLEIGFDGNSENSLQSRVVVSDHAELSGALSISEDGFNPEILFDYPLIQAASIVGKFDSVSGHQTFDPSIEIIYGTSVVVASQLFDRTPINTFLESNSEMGRRVFFDSLQTLEGNAEFRVVAPSGDLVFVSNTIPNNPDIGDFGPFRLNEVGSYEVQVFAHPDDNAIVTYDLVDAPVKSFDLSVNRVNSGQLSNPGELDLWHFNVDKASIYEMEASQIIGQGAVWFRVVNPSGRVVFETTEVTGAAARMRHTFDLSEPGEYTIEVLGRGDSTASYQFLLYGPESPRIVSNAVRGSDDESINSIWLFFNQPMDTSDGNFDLATDLLSLETPDGALAATGTRWENDGTLVVSFAEQTADTPIIISLSPGIFSLSGVPLDQDADGNAGEDPDDIYVATIRNDTIGPNIFLTDPDATASAPIEQITLYFSEPIDTSTFSQDDILRFDGPGGSLLNQIEGVLVVDDHVKIIFEQQIESGDYSISIGTSVFDPAGNALDQNQNGVSGEAEDIFTTTIRLTSPDLTVTSIANPTAATYGDEISLTWTVTNEGSDPAEGLWWDYVYLSADETWDLDDALVARVPYDAASEGAVAAEGGTYDGSVTAALPAVLPGNYHVIVRTNLLSTIAESDMTDNVLASSDAALFDLPELVDATPATVDVDYRDSLYYKFEIPEFAQGGSVLLRFGTDDTTVANELYLRRGAMPSAADYDERSRQGLSSNQYIILTNPEPGPWYAFAEVSPHISRLGELGTATTQVEFLVPGEFSVVDTSFGQGGTAGNRTIEINGANFDQTLNVSLSQNGTTIAHAMNYYRPGPEQLFATFDLRQMIPGDYDVVLTNISARSETIANGFQVVAGGGYTNQPTLTYPPAFRRVFHKPYVHFPMIVSWVNEGLNDAPIPLIHVASNEPFHRDLQAALADKGVFAETLFGFSKVGPPGILLPGESGELQLFVVPRLQGATELGENANYYVDNLLKNIDASFDFEAYRIVSRQRGLSDSENDALFNNFSADQRANPTAFQIALTEAIGNHSNDSVDGIGILQSAVADLFAAYAAGFGQSLVGAIEEIPYQSLRLGDVVVATNVETNATHASSIHSDGRFVFSRLPVGNYFLTTPRHLPLESPVAIVIEPNRTTEVTLQIAASASVSGSLTTAESSTAIAGVQVRLLNEDRAFTTETDASGGFVFSIVPIGNYKLMFESAGWQSVQKEILLGQPGVDSINNDLTSLPAPLVIGRVIDSDTGAGIAGAVVLGSDGLGHSASTLSSADGTFQLSGMPAGTWTLDVTSQGKVRETAITEAAVGNQILGEITLREGAQVDGIVKNSSGEAVPDVQIKATEVNGDTYFANVDSSGRFSLDQLPGGRYDIGIESNQFVSASKATVDVLAGVNQTGIEVIAGAAGHLQGHIFDANGQPLSNVEVRLVGNRYGNHAIQLTDDQGLYVFDRLLWDVYSVTAIFESRLSVTQSVDLRVTTDQLLDLAIPATFTIEGTVWDATETFGIPAAKIQLYDVVNNIVAIQETTQDGSFLVAGIPNGSYTLVASADGRLFKPENVEVLDGNITQPLVAYSGSVTGRITDLSGAPVIGVGVELIVPTTGSLGLIRSRVRSDDSGSYTIEGVPAGDFSIRAVDDQIGSITRSFNAVANSSTIADLQFEEMIALAGDVKDSSGDALSDVLVVISLHDSLDDSYRLTRSDADGQFALAGISPGVYDVVLVKDGFEIQLRQLDLNSSSNLQFVLAEAAATVFRVVDSQTGLPLDQVSVYFSLNGIPIGNALQNESGVLSFPSSGGWQLVALLRSGESISTQTIALPAGQEVNLESFGCSNGCAVLGSQGSAATSVMNVALSQAEGESSDGLNDIIQFAPNRIDDNRGRIEEYRRARDYIQNQFQANLPSITPIPGLPSLPGPPPAICDKDGKLLAEFRKLESTFQELIQQRDDLIKQKQFLDQTETHLRSSADNALKRAEDAIRSATTDNYEVEAKVIFLAAVGYAYGGIGSLVALILGLIDATVENIDKANGNLSVYEFSLNEVVRIRKEFNAKIPAFEDRIRQFQKDVEQYLENVRDADCSLPNLEPISDGGCINDGPFTGDVLDTKDLATLRGLVWHIRRQNTRGFSIDGKGKYRYAPEDCGSDSFTYELVIIATGVNGPETYVLSGTISFVVTDDCIDPPDPGPCQSVEQDCDEFTYTTMNCGAVDPNDIIGPIGAGEQRWIPKKELLNYIVRFENDAEKATAPAARVTIRQQLDSDLDFSTFKLGQFGFGGTVFSNATGQSSYQSRIDYTDSLGIYLDVSSSIDISTGELLFQFTSIDPETGAVPFNPLLGFLPPNVSGSEGEGFISYSIKPKTGVASGTKIDAVAEIIFDQNEAIDTPPIYNTIDAEIPGSAVMDLPSEAYPGVLVQWAGDDLNGSGISLYDVYVSRNGEQFERWLTRTSLTEAPFYAGIPGSTYSFYSVATDYVGYRETPPTVTDAITTILEPARVSQISVANDRRSLDVQFTQDMDIDGLIQSGAINETIGIETFDGSAFDLDGAQYQYDQASQTLSIELTTAIPEGTYRLSLDAVALTNDAGGQLASGISGTTFAASDFETPSNLIVSGSPLTYTGSLGPQWIDFNTDGLQDLLVVNEDAEGNHALELYLNSGNSSSPLFDDPIMVEGDEGEFQLPAQATSMPIFHDWNGDGETDLLVALDDGRIERWTNVNTNEQPILSRPQLLTYETGQGPAEIVLFASAISMIDINSDGRPDLVVGMQDGSVVAFMDQSQRGAPSFAIPQLIMVRDQTLVATSVSNLGTGDLNHDGKSDLLITSNDGHLLFYPNVGSNAMRFLGGWDISAEAFAGLPAGTSVSSATFGDINGDGRTDLLVSSNDGIVHQILALGETTSLARTSLIEADPTQYIEEFVVKESMVPIWTNPLEPHDVDDMNGVTTTDALIVINYIARVPDGRLPSEETVPHFYYDVNGDEVVSPIDALRVLNFLAIHGSGEQEHLVRKPAAVTLKTERETLLITDEALTEDTFDVGSAVEPAAENLSWSVEVDEMFAGDLFRLNEVSLLQKEKTEEIVREFEVLKLF